MTGLALFVLAVYTVSLLYITVYCLLQFNLLYHYKQSNNPTKHPVSFADMVPTEASTQEFMLVGAAPGFALSGSSLAPAAEPTEYYYPFVTIQLPIYNELYVIARLIDACTKFDYPKDRFEIHILDDSTDETVEIVAEKVKEY
ncbi:MAG: cellulose synthase/poly-beta-1,6-N-acetylglucosamine synthase-like glycosyltransferase, partial [Neolewinella sp.]